MVIITAAAIVTATVIAAAVFIVGAVIVITGTAAEIDPDKRAASTASQEKGRGEGDAQSNSGAYLIHTKTYPPSKLR
jgi:hypothetical protein